jgi:SAM-dependent methyltransferase
VTPATDWGRKAAELYRPDYARKYRAHDDQLDAVNAVDPYARFCRWLGEACDRFDREIDVLELGCGTGRYFRAVRHTRALTGIDASPAMLAEARFPVGASEITAGSIELVHADIVTCDLGPSRFDLVYSIGVLAEHTPLNARVVANVFRWLRPGGRFAFTTVHPDSPSVPRTWPRAAARLVLPLTVGPLRRRLRERLAVAGLYADDALIRERLAAQFEIESLAHAESEAHFHCLCIARKVEA